MVDQVPADVRPLLAAYENQRVLPPADTVVVAHDDSIWDYDHEAVTAASAAFDTWVARLTSGLITRFGHEDRVLTALAPVAALHSRFAVTLFPVVVQRITKDHGPELSRRFRDLLSQPQLPPVICHLLLAALGALRRRRRDEIHTQQKLLLVQAATTRSKTDRAIAIAQIPAGTDYVLEVDYRTVTQAALRSRAYASALYYAERMCERENGRVRIATKVSCAVVALQSEADG